MSLMNYALLAVLLVAVGALLYVRHTLVYKARLRPWWLTFYLAAAALMVAFTLATSHTLDDYASGAFIVGMLLVFAGWRRGISHLELVNGFGSMRPLSQLTQVQLSADKGGTLLVATVGQVTVVKMRFAQAPAVLAKYLKRQMPPERVVMPK
ncbi:hypothetical protein [Lacticaseibacillus kribbianus]|uniref:hypothetical protein n=1 Tax=Lacticaseibacillus kribbianus TaxID=2926292 RepID=UPI001CD25C66|nr:hypothetical protein [Lacticaseibacillus kribbianus]